MNLAAAIIRTFQLLNGDNYSFIVHVEVIITTIKLRTFGNCNCFSAYFLRDDKENVLDKKVFHIYGFTWRSACTSKQDTNTERNDN